MVLKVDTCTFSGNGRVLQGCLKIPFGDIVTIKKFSLVKYALDSCNKYNEVTG